MAEPAENGWQRLDKWLWCARFLRQRADCARLISEGRVRVNRQPTDKPHARVRVGDVVTVPVADRIRVVRVCDLGLRRGPASEACQLFADIEEASEVRPVPCATPETPPYRAAGPLPTDRHQEPLMTYVVTDNCIRCKYMDCVEVCPVDCFYVGENMLVIHPDECIDCGVCEPECPAEAIVPDSDDQATAWVEHNRTYATQWPNITRKGEAPADADEWKGKPDKAPLFSPEPGKP